MEMWLKEMDRIEEEEKKKKRMEVFVLLNTPKKVTQPLNIR